MTETAGGSPGSSNRRAGSVRVRLGGWTILVCSLTLAVFSATAVVEERSQVLRTETAYANALLTHLAQMPELQGDLGAAAAHLLPLRALLRTLGGDLELAPAGGTGEARGDRGLAVGWTVLAAHAVPRGDGPFELRYLNDRRRVRAATLRSAGIHLLHGGLALVALLFGIDWILRRRLLAPVRALSEQVHRMRAGGGWISSVPSTDAELEGLARAVGDLGPDLERQVREWIEAERRAGVALAIAGIRGRIREPHRRAVETVAELLDYGPLAAEASGRLRSVLTDLERLPQALAEQESETVLGRGPANRHPDGGADRPGSSVRRRVANR